MLESNQAVEQEGGQYAEDGQYHSKFEFAEAGLALQVHKELAGPTLA
jgi:hypothetical protein